MLPWLETIGSTAITPAFAEVSASLSRWPTPVLAIGVPLIFVLAYLLVVLEEVTHMRKSKPVMLAAGLIWTLIAIFPPMDGPQNAASHAPQADAGENG